MGLFSSSSQIYVASSVYNLAGDEIDRPDYVKQTVFSALMNPYSEYIGESIVRSYITGPGTMQRSFFNWAVKNNISGLPTLKVDNVLEVTDDIMLPFIPVPSTPEGAEIVVETSSLLDGNYSHWAQKWLLENNPNEIDNGWVADYNQITHQIIIQYSGGETVSFDATNYNKTSKYVVSKYYAVNSIGEYIVDSDAIFIYEIGTGNTTLDALAVQVIDDSTSEYYPFIPIRLNNQSITEAGFEDLYIESKNAYKRATGGIVNGQNLDAVLAQVEDNPDIGDIDYSYIQWGVSVNTNDKACLKYMYKWLQNMILYQNTTPTTMSDIISSGSSTTPQSTIIRLVSADSQLSGFDNRFTWVNITETSHTGLSRPEAVSGDIWLENESSLVMSSGTLDAVAMYKQTSSTTYNKLIIWGLVHENYIYGGKVVRTTLAEGIVDLEDSPFIIPLHAPTVKDLGLKDFTQMSVSNTFITFNSYQVVKKKWYQTFLGMLLIIVAIAVIAVLVSPAVAAEAVGIFGANATVGATLGLTGTAAIVAGAVTNALAAIVLTKVITSASVSLFGEKWGAIIAAIVSFAINFGISNGFSNMNLTSVLEPQTLLKFSSALANGYDGYVEANISEIDAEMAASREEYGKAIEDIEDLMKSKGLINDLLFDPMTLTNSVKGNESTGIGSYVPETLDEFIGRTTMLGSDVVEITLSMVSDYSDLQLTLPRN